MARLRHLGNLEREVMDHLWAVNEPQTVRQVHQAICAQRPLAYTTVTTVLRRLADKGIALQLRQDRAHRYAASRSRDQLVAALMLDALGQVTDQRGKHAALVHFVAQVKPDEIDVLRRALAGVDPHRTEIDSATGYFAIRRSA